MELLIFGMVAASLGGVVLAYLAFFGLRTLQQEVRGLRQEVVLLRQRLLALEPSPPTPASTGVDKVIKAAVADSPPAAEPSGRSAQPEPLPAASLGLSQLDEFAGQLSQSTSAWLSFVKTHWMILIGGCSLALAGIFLIHYSVESGLLSPPLRVGLAALFGSGLIGLASWLKEHRADGRIHPACAGAGVLILYACALASGPLYGWLPPGWAFALLGLVSAFAMGLALRHGPVLAAIGILGAFAVPLLIDTGSDNVAAALGYALIVAAGGFALMRWVYRDWLWWGVWLLALAWLVLSLTQPEQASGLRSLYLVSLAWMGLAFPLLGLGLTQYRCALARPSWMQYSLTALWLMLAIAQWAVMSLEAHSWWRFAGAVPLFVLALLVSRHPIPGGRYWPWIALLPPILELTAQLPSLTPLYVEGQISYLLMAAGYGLFALVAAGSLAWHQGRGQWALLCCLVPLLMIVLVDLRLSGVAGGFLHWSVSLGLSSLFAAVLWRWRSRAAVEARAGGATISAILLLAVQAALTLTLVAGFAELRLTLALALQWLSLVLLSRYFEQGLPARALDWAARGLLTAVVLRLTLNPWLPDYGATPLALLLTYLGCFVMALVTLVQLYRQQSDPVLRRSFEAGVVQLAMLALIAATRYQLYGDLFAAQLSWLESGIYVMALLAGAALYRWRGQRDDHRFLVWLSELQLVLGLLLYAAFALLQNPVQVAQSVGTTPFWNVLLLMYGVPALLLGLLAWQRDDAHRYDLVWLAALASGVFVVLEIRHLWHEGLQPGQPILTGELYSYSALGLLVGIGVMLLAARRGLTKLRRIGTVVLLAVITKIFFWDMADLDGLWRVASFLGLGVSLLGIAYLYNRANLELSGQGLESQ
ncbi:DUF2339 domain-containing protein [Ferrimonas marina]|uniref:Uncharacterized membrane protein n=1 Tax=Ferrimonas marina TaxID=299255 RepID=A0A1M5XSD4_9GAMM|nr:DUF2339 domain-containing protein [Ferrimonas marina]SHI02717.1 Uncharacterized membrane protein [Ferrimonas marina]